MGRYSWNVLGISEVRWLNFGEATTEEGHKIWYNGEQDKHELGVAIMVHKDTTNSVISWPHISSRIITIRLSCMPQNITIVQVYAPTSNATDEKCEDFYNELETVLTNIPKKDILIARLHNLTIANTLFPHKASRRTT